MKSELLTECTYSQTSTPYARHFHNTHELIYLLDGRAEIRVGTKLYLAEPGSLLFVSKLEEHSVRITETPYRRYYLQLSSPQLDALLDEPGLKSIFISRPPGFSHQFFLPTDTTRPLFESLCREYKNPGAFSQSYLSALFTQLMVSCFRKNEIRFPLPCSSVRVAIFDAQAYLDTHFAEPISIKELAKQFYLSPSYLSHAFKAWTGYSPKRYLLLTRLSYAKELLLRPGSSVTETAFACGFQDINNFIRSFKAENGVTPTRYRAGGA